MTSLSDESRAVLEACEVRKMGYSHSPWRIVHVPSLDGTHSGDKLAERYVEAEPFTHPALGTTSLLPVMGYRTKRDAQAALSEALERRA